MKLVLARAALCAAGLLLCTGSAGTVRSLVQPDEFLVALDRELARIPATSDRPELLQYLFRFTGDPMAGAWGPQAVKTSPVAFGWTRVQGNDNAFIVWVRASQPASDYSVSIELPDGSKAQTSFKHTPLATRTVVVFIQGVGTRLSGGDEEPNPDCPISPVVGGGTFACLKQALTLGPYSYSSNDFLEYSYKGGEVVDGRWAATDYDCHDIGQNTLRDDALTLHSMLGRYAEAHSDLWTQFVLVGHSFGGLVAFTGLQDESLNREMPYRVRAVITLDSPLKGVSAPTIDAWPNFVQEPCFVTPLTGFDELREMASDRSETVARQGAIADAAAAAGISLYTLGNLDDCMYRVAELGCRPDLVVGLNPFFDETDTQIMERTSVQVFDLMSLGTAGGFMAGGHGVILSDPGMVSRTASYVGGQSAAPPVVVGPNLAPNPSFEVGTGRPAGWRTASPNWAVQTWATVAHTGARSLSISGPTLNPTNGAPYAVSWEIVDPLAITGSKGYRLSAWVRGGTGGGGRFDIVIEATGTKELPGINGLVLPTAWQQFTRDIQIPAQAANATLRINYTSVASGDKNTIYFDDISLYELAP